MKLKIAKMWTKALRSKKFKQGKDVLKQRTKAGVTRHCCLGVLCELYQKTHKRKLKTKINKCWVGSKSSKCAVTQFDEIETDLPARVRKWAGMKTPNGRLPPQLTPQLSGGTSLTTLNDDDDFSFPQIAGVIDENYKSL